MSVKYFCFKFTVLKLIAAVSDDDDDDRNFVAHE